MSILIQIINKSISYVRKLVVTVWSESLSSMPTKRVSLHARVRLVLLSFIDDQLHLSQHPSPECEFTFEQKNYQIDYKRKPDRK